MDGIFKIHEQDNVAIALSDIAPGQTVSLEDKRYTAQSAIPSGHKMALKQIDKGGRITKYGLTVGYARAGITEGEWVHSHNMETGLSGVEHYTFRGGVPFQPKETDETISAYVRKNGEIGIRNELWIIATVSCVNRTVELLAQRANQEIPSFSGEIHAFPHNTGCSQMGEDQENSRKLLANIIRHPNAGGVLVVSLGCENSNWEVLKPYLGDYDKSRIRVLITQEEDGDEIEKGLNILKALAAVAGNDKRQSVSVGKLKIGFKCGASDAFSGITANPLCGLIAEQVTAKGGIAVLTEVPEMFGAEERLMERAVNKETFDRIVGMINRFKQYYMEYDQPVYENPAPGNKAGGITTLEEKSAGCIQKGGQSPVTGTLDYGDYAVTPGLNLMNGPGNDSVSVTNLVSCGVHLILFTTGRGNPLGTAVPVVKIASNTRIFSKKPAWFDYNAGKLLENTTKDVAADELWKLTIDVACGSAKTRNETNDYRDIMLFKSGAVL